jgi:hypothetical protein
MTHFDPTLLEGHSMSKHETSIVDGPAALLAPGEEIISALVVSPRGSSTAAAPGLAPSEIGRRWSNKNTDAAERVGLSVKRSSGLALTNRRLVTVDLAISLTGSIKQVKELLSQVPVDQVDEIREQMERAHNLRRRRPVQARVQASRSKSVR